MRPGENRGAWKECLALLPPGPDAVHTLPPPRPVDGTNGFLHTSRRFAGPLPQRGPATSPLTPPASSQASRADGSRRRATPVLAVRFRTARSRSVPEHGNWSSPQKPGKLIHAGPSSIWWIAVTRPSASGGPAAAPSAETTPLLGSPPGSGSVSTTVHVPPTKRARARPRRAANAHVIFLVGIRSDGRTRF
jgi:hypothetical protein